MSLKQQIVFLISFVGIRVRTIIHAPMDNNHIAVATMEDTHVELILIVVSTLEISLIAKEGGELSGFWELLL